MEPRVGIAHIEITAADGTFAIGREAFPDFERYARLGVHIQSDDVRIATPPGAYVEAALTALADACRELGVAHADVAFVDTVVAPPRFGLRYGFKGAYTTDRPEVIWIFANWTSQDELWTVVRHEAAHLAFYDAETQLLLTGDTLYPGRLFIDDWTAYQASVARWAAAGNRGAEGTSAGYRWASIRRRPATPRERRGTRSAARRSPPTRRSPTTPGAPTYA